MFWDANSCSKSIDNLLSKEDVTLKELLDDEDILQDYKENKNLTKFLHRVEIIDELVTLITTEPPADVADNVRFKYSNIACEILTSEVPVLIEQLVSSRPTLEKLYGFLEQEPPLNPLLTSFCSKTFGMLLSKKSDQDWFTYQCVCLQMLEFIKSRPNFLNTIYKHMSTPVIVDLLFQIITSIEGDELRNSLFQWLSEQQLICNLIGMLGNETDADKHQNIANLLCELIATGRNARQNEIQKQGYGYADSANDSTDPLIHILEDESTTDLLLELILSNKSESSIVSGITIILKLLENPIINEPVSDTALQQLADAENVHHKNIVANIVRQMQPRIKELHDLLMNPPAKTNIENTAAVLSPPFGSTRMHICTMLSVLIETGNQEIINAICETEFFNVLLDLFKQYCWNNILHSQVKKCFSFAFSAFEHSEESTCIPSALQTHILVKCNVASKLIDCWKHNDESESKENGRRLGYMGHLIYLFDSLHLLVLVSHQFRALVESNLTEDELSYWKLVTDPINGYLVTALKAQKSYLGGIDPNQSDSYDTSASKDFQDESFSGDYYNDIESNMNNVVDDRNDAARVFEATCSMRNSNTYDIRDSEIKYNFDELMNEFRDDISDNNIFGGGEHYSNANSGDSLMAKNETDWADFDSHFNDFQINDNNAFPTLEQSHQNVRGINSSNNNGKLNTFQQFDGFEKKNNTSADVLASVNTRSNQDYGGNDIKRWNSVVSDMDDIQATDQLTAEQTTETAPSPILSNEDHDGNDVKQCTSVVSDTDDIQATDQLTAEQTTETETSPIPSNQDHDGNDVKRCTPIIVSGMHDIQATDQLTAEQTTETATSPTLSNQDHSGNDDKRSIPVVNDIDDIQAIDQLIAEQTTNTGTNNDPQ